MKKTLVSLLLAAMLVVSSFAGLAIYEIPEQYAMPISDGSTPQLKIYMGTESGYEKAYLTYDEHVAILAWEEATGLDFTFVHPPLNDDGSYFNTVIASGNLPDMWSTGSFGSYYAGGVEGAIEDGLLENLNPYIEQYGYWYLVEAHKNWDASAEKNFMTDSGMYRFGAASQRVPVLGQQHSGPVIREDLLEAIDADMPETIEQFHDAMVAMKEAGLVEVPIAFEKLTSSYYYDNPWFANDLGVTTNSYVLNEDGTVTYAQLMPEYKDWLQRMIDWYNEGLFDVDCMSRTHSDAEAMVTSGQSAVVNIGNWETQEDIAVGKAACGDDFNLLGMSTLAADEDSIGTLNPFCRPIINGTNGNYWGITTTNPAKVESFEAFDWLYSPEGTELMVFGPEKAIDQLHRDTGVEVDVHWTNEDGTRQFSDYILHNDELEYNSIRYIYTIQSLSSEYASEMEYMQYGEPCNAQCWEAWTKDVDDSRKVPSCISLTAAESQTCAPIMTDVDSYIWEHIYNIIFGNESIDTWETHVEKLYELGIQTVLDIRADATARYIAR